MMSAMSALASADLYRSDRVHRALVSPDRIDDVAMAHFRREGFLAVEGVFEPGQVEEAQRAISELIATKALAPPALDFEKGVDVDALPPEKRELHVRKLMWFSEHDQRLKSFSQNPVLLSIVRRIVGSDVRMIQDMALLKPPHIGREKPWHQDAAYFLYEPLDLIVGTWTALDPATIENGCMHVIPRSHLDGPRPHYHDRDCQLPDDRVDHEHDECVPLAPGGVLLFSGLLHHGTPPNNSPARRRALQFHYASVNCREIDEAAHERMFHDKTGYAGCQYGRMRPIRERSF
jgi:phytanoyl-CoA hydroxylase